MNVTNDEINIAFESVRRFVASNFRQGTLKYQQAMDRATTTFLNTIPKYKPEIGKPFTNFALRSVRRSLTKIHAKTNREHYLLIDQHDEPRNAITRKSDPIDWELLPPPLRDICWLRSQGFNYVDVGLLLGVCHQTVMKRIETARSILVA